MTLLMVNKLRRGFLTPSLEHSPEEHTATLAQLSCLSWMDFWDWSSVTRSATKPVNEWGVILRDDNNKWRFEMSHGSPWTSVCQDVSSLMCRLSETPTPGKTTGRLQHLSPAVPFLHHSKRRTAVLSVTLWGDDRVSNCVLIIYADQCVDLISDPVTIECQMP